MNPFEEHFADFASILQGRQLLRLSVCFPAHQSQSEKGSILKGKNLLLGSKFFPFRIEQILSF